MSERILVKYDGRFGHDEYCKEARWFCNPDMHGEQWLFGFPNGKTVSVIRHASWNYNWVAQFNSCAASMGFALGLYEIAVMDGDDMDDPVGFLEQKDVVDVLDRVMNIKKE